jgi:hypothetical protein
MLTISALATLSLKPLTSFSSTYEYATKFMRNIRDASLGIIT